MKINNRHNVTATLTNAEIKAFEEWGTKAGLCVNAAVKTCINFTIKNKNPLEEHAGEQATMRLV